MTVTKMYTAQSPAVMNHRKELSNKIFLSCFPLPSSYCIGRLAEYSESPLSSFPCRKDWFSAVSRAGLLEVILRRFWESHTWFLRRQQATAVTPKVAGSCGHLHPKRPNITSMRAELRRGIRCRGIIDRPRIVFHWRNSGIEVGSHSWCNRI
jgi:hypothetical protein